ncbi:PREDICTED: alpha-catulin isoform X4 [Papilio polytes]|uniref:alpha-catulin isoform X4 n=1 Tax=Papilio polytes TaxID=76194 RepID=UPI000676561A|nr:PREDICTED: alpha-catulin isoform X4 [Papilio polytes]
MLSASLRKCQGGRPRVVGAACVRVAGGRARIDGRAGNGSAAADASGAAGRRGAATTLGPLGTCASAPALALARPSRAITARTLDARSSDMDTLSDDDEYARREHQISSLVATRGEAAGGAAVQRVGAAVCCAVERFVAVGETIADDNPDVRHSMVLACKEARAAGRAIERVCSTGGAGGGIAEGAGMVCAARALLAAVTRVLLLADMVVVRQLLLAKDKVARSLDRLESVSNFAEFVRAFTEFGGGMVELARLTAERRADLRDERRRAQVAAARNVLERSTLMLLTSSKTCMRHPGSASARENRDTVFCQMRRAMDLIHYVVRDGLPGHEEQSHEAAQWEAGTALGALRGLTAQVRAARARGGADAARRRALASTLRALVERTHDFTDSAYTSHDHRQRILALAERIAYELERLVAVAVSMEEQSGGSSCGGGAALESACAGAAGAAGELERALVAAAREQARDLPPLAEDARRLAADLAYIGNPPRSIASSGSERESERLHNIASRLHEQLDHIIEVCKLLRHIAMSETLQVSAKFAEINLRIYGPQVVTAARTLAAHPGSAAARENLDVFVDMWAWLLSDAARLAKELLDLTDDRPDKQQYSSLPRPGKHGTTSKPLKAVRLDSDEQAKIAKSGLEMKMMSSEMDAETEKWQGADENNDIVKRAKNMSSMAFAMYQFTKGEGRLNTTQDLFTQAEYFAEEANRLYKIVRQFSYQVPAGTMKKELLEHLDKVPTYVQQLQFTVKEPTVGRAATFSKVDNVIQETKHLMNVISKVVTTCFDCANKYSLCMPERVPMHWKPNLQKASTFKSENSVLNG